MEPLAKQEVADGSGAEGYQPRRPDELGQFYNIGREQCDDGRCPHMQTRQQHLPGAEYSHGPQAIAYFRRQEPNVPGKQTYADEYNGTKQVGK